MVRFSVLTYLMDKDAHEQAEDYGEVLDLDLELKDKMVRIL